MTIEEAIKELKRLNNILPDDEGYEPHEALYMAIDALKSKQAQLNAIELINKMVDYKTVAENIG